ncbi:hypothetical protein D3C84_842440 [compost metagenome]
MLILFFSTISEGMKVLGIVEFNITKSFEYFFLWVIPYWWLILLITSLIIACTTVGIMKLKKRN